MYKLLSPLKFIQSRKLWNTKWRCDTADIEPAIEYYELHFKNASTVEGYSKSETELTPQHMFTASYYIKDKIFVHFINSDESFSAVLSSKVLMATIDGEMLLFKKCP